MWSFARENAVLVNVWNVNIMETSVLKLNNIVYENKVRKRDENSILLNRR